MTPNLKDATTEIGTEIGRRLDVRLRICLLVSFVRLSFSQAQLFGVSRKTS